MRRLIATSNKGKIQEFREMLGGDHFQWDDLSAHPPIVPPEETGRTFRANACLKAAFYARLLAQYTLADDSGLEVDALSGSPGVESARWAKLHNAGQGDAANNALLLKQLEAVPDFARTARFVCVLALSDPQGRILLTARDTIEGIVLHKPRGENGFGYDPLFLFPTLGKTTAELSPDEKHQVSHRGKALRRLRPLLDLLPERAGE
jgi:XTP/dITP diphosphohydrolase